MYTLINMLKTIKKWFKNGLIETSVITNWAYQKAKIIKSHSEKNSLEDVTLFVCSKQLRIEIVDNGMI